MREDENAAGAAQTETASRLRQQIIEAANEHFSRYGYAKTTVSDLAREIGFSKAYIYKFFSSKQEIGESICRECLGDILQAIDQAIMEAPSASEKLRRFVLTATREAVRLFFNDRKIYEIAAHSAAEGWSSTVEHCSRLRERMVAIVQEGRSSGEFERKTPLDDVIRAIMAVILPLTNPLMLQYVLDAADTAALDISSLVLRSLAP